MAMTPEGRVKAGIDELLRVLEAYHHKPVQNGMGKPALDYHVCRKGCYAGIEAKAPGKKPTSRQENTMRKIYRAGGSVFLIDGLKGVDSFQLAVWLADPSVQTVSSSAKYIIFGETNAAARDDRSGNP